MPVFLRIATAVVALAIAVWAGIAVARDRPPSRTTLLGLWVVELFALALVGSAIASMIGGARVPMTAAFVGYLVAFAAIPIAAWALARMEPTKWGSVIIAVAAIVEAILVVRLEQVWTGI